MTCATALGCRTLSSAAPDASLDQAAVLAALRARVARLEGAGRAPHAAGAIPVCEGVPLPGGGLARAAVHEVLATSPGCGAAFCAVLLARTGGTVVWIAAGQDGLLVYRTRFSGQWVALNGTAEGLFEPCGTGVERAAMAVLLDQPFGVVAGGAFTSRRDGGGAAAAPTRPLPPPQPSAGRRTSSAGTNPGVLA